MKKVKCIFFDTQATDKKTLAYVFYSCWEAARELTAEKCTHFTDNELKRDKNIQHIKRVLCF